MATPQFHPLRIREIRPETADAVSVAFEVPAELREQYRRLTRRARRVTERVFYGSN